MLSTARLAILLILIAALLSSANPVFAQSEPGDGDAISSDGEALMPEIVVQDATLEDLKPDEPLPAAVFLRIEYDEGGLFGGSTEERLLRLYEFYDARFYEPMWVSADGPNDKARDLINALLDAENDALNPGDYDLGTISALLGTITPTALADFEIRLSKALLDFGRDLSVGRVEPSKIDSDIAVFPDGPGADELLTGLLSAANTEAFLADLAPQSPNYARLKDALAIYRGMAANGGWVRVPDGEVLKPGMRQPRVADLRRRLFQTDDYDPLTAATPENADLYDEGLVEAVKRFQDRHGLDTDGVVGPGTLAALNVSAAERVAQIELNMERRRWMPDDLGENYVFVNLADFELKVVRGAKTVHTTRVVIGKPYHRTPVFSREITYLEINPFWNVPASIARNELLPKLRRDPGSLRRDRIRVLSGEGEVDPYSVNWNAIGRSMPYRLRQDSGDGNALGRIKFMFPNEFNVYLHDTPSKSLFERSVRSFSHGCIRVQNPIALAEVLLQGQDNWSKDAIQSAIGEGRRRVVGLDTPIPVHITYLTAWMNKDGSVHFGTDIYERDKALAAALQRSRGSV